METISIVSAKSIWLMNLADINPKGLRLFPDLSDALVEAYDFDEQPDDAPTTLGNTTQPSIKFENGQFDTPNGVVRVGLELYADGIVADTSISTDITDAFVQHALNWGNATFGLNYDPRLLMKKMYASEVVVRLNSSFSKHLTPLNAFAELLTKAIPGGQRYAPIGVNFSSVAPTPNPFFIERRANTPIDSNVFYSKASIDTALHLKLLGEFDALLGQD